MYMYESGALLYENLCIQSIFEHIYRQPHLTLNVGNPFWSSEKNMRAVGSNFENNTLEEQLIRSTNNIRDIHSTFHTFSNKLFGGCFETTKH